MWNWPRKTQTVRSENQRSTDYKRPTQSTNKWFPLKHGSQATEHNENKIGIMNNNNKKTLKEEQTTNLLFRPSCKQIHAFLSLSSLSIPME